VNNNEKEELENKLIILTEENNKLQQKINELDNKERQRGVYLLLADLKVANINIQNLIKQLEEKESEIRFLKIKGTQISGNEQEDKFRNEIIEKINKYEKTIDSLNINLNDLKLQNTNINNILKEKNLKIEILEKNNNHDQMISDFQSKLNKCLLEIEENKKENNFLKTIINDLEELKKRNTIELGEKIQLISTLQTEIISLKNEIKIIKELNQQNLLKLNSNLDSNINENFRKIIDNQNNLNDTNSPDLSFNKMNRKMSSENFGLDDNLKEDFQSLYSKSLKKIETLKRNNEKLNIQLTTIKEEQKTEIMRLNLTIDELAKLTKNTSENCLHENNYNFNNETGRVSSIVKNIQSKINENTIDELKKEKIEYLETIKKLKMQLEAIENGQNMDISTNLLQIDLFPKNFSNEKLNNINKINEKNILNTLNDNEKILINDLMEKSQNEIKERERKIEYLLQILEEKNNLIEQLQSSDKNTSNNQSIEAKDQIDFVNFQNENLMKELEEKNLKIKKLNKDLNEQLAKYEILNAEYLELQDKENDINIYKNEIELLKEKNKEYEKLIEKMNKELNVKSNNLIRKETEVTTLKADRLNNINNKSLLDKTLYIENNGTNAANNSFVKDPKLELLNNSLNEIRDLKEKLRQNNLNRSIRSKRGNSVDSINSSNNSINLNISNNNIPRVIFEDINNNKKTFKKKKNNINNSVNSMDNSLTADIQNFNLGLHFNENQNEEIDSKIREKKEELYLGENEKNVYDIKTDINKISDLNNNNFIQNKEIYNNKTNNTFNKQAIFVPETYSPTYQDFNRNSYPISNTNFLVNNTDHKMQNYPTNLENKNLQSNDKINNVNKPYNLLYNKNLFSSFDFNNFDNLITTTGNETYNSNNNNYKSQEDILQNTLIKKDFTNPNIRIPETIKPDDILQSQDSWDKIRTWIANTIEKQKDKFYFKRIFKAKEMGFDCESFHFRCQGKSPTIVILKNNHGKIIGGFTQIPWKIPQNLDFLDDPTKSSFLFSINLNKRYNLKDNMIAVCHSANSGPMFGLNDLEIVENANKKFNNFSNIGTSYQFDDKLEDFYGDVKYLVEDYEVYELILF